MASKTDLTHERVIKVIIAEDQHLSRKGYVSLLSDHPKIKVINEAINGKHLLECLEQELPDIVLLDIKMPIMDGREALKAIKKLFPSVKTIMLSMYNEPEFILDFIKNGASGYVSKGDEVTNFIETIFKVYEYGFFYSNQISQLINQNFAQTDKLKRKLLTDREMDIAKLICSGKAHKNIASELNVTLGTINFHTYNIYKKLNINTKIELVNYCNTRGVV